MCTYVNGKLIAYTGVVPANLALGQPAVKKKPTYRKQVPAVNKRPGPFGADFITVEQAVRRLEKLARCGITMNSAKAKHRSADIAKDDGSIAVGASFCSSKAAHHEMCNTVHRKAIKTVGPCDEFWNTRQPWFKGVERNPRRARSVEIY